MKKYINIGYNFMKVNRKYFDREYLVFLYQQLKILFDNVMT